MLDPKLAIGAERDRLLGSLAGTKLNDRPVTLLRLEAANTRVGVRLHVLSSKEPDTLSEFFSGA